MTSTAVSDRRVRVHSALPGLLLCLAVAILAYALGRLVPLVGGPVFGIVLGVIIAVVRKPGDGLAPGIKFASKQLLQLSIILLGFNLQLQEVVGGGLRSLPVMLGTLFIVLTAAYIVGKVLGLDRDLRRLLGVGTAICGGSAIAAVSSVIDVSEADVAYAISAVFLFNVLAVLLFPPIGHLLALSQHAFGLWAGTAINDTSSVVAAGFAYGHAAGNQAVIVKLTRTTLIIPIVLFYAGKRIWHARANGEGIKWVRIIPWFILWFIAAAVLNTFGVVPPALHSAIGDCALFLIVVALTGVGLSADAKGIRAAGVRPLLLGFVLWALIAASSLAIAHAFSITGS
ncbi:MAG TPA: putative sulfate exporter family transporter [Candidatus Baltobacteraceae bacterium]|nr:putative sulfate exporter family transporter [Candidatus Baltobacteraceae bacterium]